jgi:hypothetical protein
MAADKALNARGTVIDAAAHPAIWKRSRAGLEGMDWYSWGLHQELEQLLPANRCSGRDQPPTASNG